MASYKLNEILALFILAERIAQPTAHNEAQIDQTRLNIRYAPDSEPVSGRMQRLVRIIIRPSAWSE
jgi:hypothetical protein